MTPVPSISSSSASSVHRSWLSFSRSVAAERLGIEYFDAGNGGQPDADALSRLDPATAAGQQALPLRRQGADGLVVAVADPMNQAKLSLVEKLSRCRITPALASRSGLAKAVARAYGLPAAPPARHPAAELRLGDAPVAATPAAAFAQGP